MTSKKKKSAKRTANPNHELSNTLIKNGRDRMMKYKKNPPCPKCGAHPSVCMMRLPKFAAFRCRQCGYRWEVK